MVDTTAEYAAELARIKYNKHLSLSRDAMSLTRCWIDYNVGGKKLNIEDFADSYAFLYTSLELVSKGLYKTEKEKEKEKEEAKKEEKKPILENKQN